MSNSIPSIEDLKTQAARLRSTRIETGCPTTHSQSLELIAKSYGLRDWNTLRAKAAQTDHTPGYKPGQRLRGLYLGHAFEGTVLYADPLPGHKHRLTIKFDTAIDVVTSQHFSSFRRRITKVVSKQGRTLEKTSDGQPHLILTL
ncbi:glyoxalase superfamily protein [Aestuariibius sp. HNIBRBA575]|uniref:glyoxalase superfamily protein n=1 Tax=Aestuariibius sp. HNIBRBA575 TaxID=3233343 RepID=UPI0034A36BE4